jgi:hypothetical protein
MNDGLNSRDYLTSPCKGQAMLRGGGYEGISTQKHVSSLFADPALIGVTRYESNERTTRAVKGFAIGVELFHPPASSFLHQPFDPAGAWNSRGMANTAALSQSVSRCD